MKKIFIALATATSLTGIAAQADDLSDALQNMQQASHASHSSCRTIDQSEHCTNLHIKNIVAHYDFMAAVERELQQKSPNAIRGGLQRKLSKMHKACADTKNPDNNPLIRTLNGLNCEEPMMKAGLKLLPTARKFGIIQ